MSGRNPVRYHALDNRNESSSSSSSFLGGIFIEPTLPSSFARLIAPPADVSGDLGIVGIRFRKGKEVFGGFGFLSVSLKSDVEKRGLGLSRNGAVPRGKEEGVVVVRRGGGGGVAINTTKHLWAGAVAAMVSRKQLLRLSGNEETTNSERFIAGAAAGITATILCLPLDTIRTKLVAQGGEALGGVISAFRHMIRTEGFFSLYKGLVPSIISMAPSGAVFYGVYDILKSAYLHSPEGRRRIQNLSQQGQELNAFDQLELGPMRTLLYGAISGACAEAATYPFEVVRRQLQLQDQAKRLGSFATLVKVVERGGVPALYAGLVPSLLQVLPSAAISYFIYEFMKVVLNVD